MHIYSIFDSKVCCFGQPFFQRTDAEALRTFIDLVNDKRQGNLVSMHPGDFDLYYLGDFSDASGFISCEKGGQPLKKCLGCGSQFVGLDK